VRRSLADDESAWQRMLEIQHWNVSELLTEVPNTSKEQAIVRGVKVVHDLLPLFNKSHFSFADPAHGAGHMIRDYVNALRLARHLKIDAPNLFIGLVAGVFHDVGCMVFPRYEEGRHVARHAEAGAFLLDTIFQSHSLGLSRAERMLIEYGVAAHTNYLEAMTLKDSNGVLRRLEPYKSATTNGQPILAVWFPRWVDRQDCNGPGWTGRHYLSFIEPHEELFGERERTRVITYEQHMRPLLRLENEIQKDPKGRTMVEYFANVLSTQHTGSSYCPYDYGAVVLLRDRQNKRLGHIIDAVRGPTPIPGDLEEGMVLSGWTDVAKETSLVPNNLHEEVVLRAWTECLAKNIEPTELGKRAADQLKNQFRGLDATARAAWTRGFWMTMNEYVNWATEVLKDLVEMPPPWYPFKPITDNVINIITPNRTWCDRLKIN